MRHAQEGEEKNMMQRNLDKTHLITEHHTHPSHLTEDRDV
jgi:hypothetical protein